MSREIIFRGLRADGGGWVEGLPFYSYTRAAWCIVYGNGWTPSYSNPDEGESNVFIEVIPSTVGMYSNKSDINGKLACQGDSITLAKDGIAFSLYRAYVVFDVAFDGCEFVLKYHLPGHSSLHGKLWGRLSRLDELGWTFEIIGNIHEEVSNG